MRDAETCTADGAHEWAAVGAGGFACDESDRYVLDSSDDVVTLSGDVVLTSGAIVCSAGRLVIEPGARLTWVYAWGGVERGRYGAGASALQGGADPWQADAAAPDLDLAFRTFVDAGHPPSATPTACNDHLDDDGDGGIDFDGAGVGPPDSQYSAGHLAPQAASPFPMRSAKLST